MRGFTLIDALLMLTLAAIVAIVVVPQRRVKRIMDAEDRIVEDLRDIERRLEEHQKAGTRDADRDGIGEFGPLTAVLGSRAEAARRIGSTDVWELDGYRFAVLTPDSRKLPVLAGSPEEVTDYAEVAYVISAWPAEPGVTGMRAYCETPYGILQHQLDGCPYGDDPPAPGWEMISFEDGRPRRARPSANDGDWKSPVRDLRK